MTEERVREIEAMTPDDVLIDIATTCSNRGVALSAEMALRRRYPSKRTPALIRKRKNKLTGGPRA